MIFGAAGLAIDIGRLYIAKNEAQSYADSASLYGALEIDGTAQVLVNSFTSGGSGLFPFSPISHSYGTTADAVLAADPTGNMGFTVGGEYTLRWPSNPNSVNFNNICTGDAATQWLSKSDASNNS